MFDDLITYNAPPPNRLGKCEGDHEHHLPEGAVMVAFAIVKCRFIRTANTASGSIFRDGSESTGS
jgi:hypothetical protein